MNRRVNTEVIRAVVVSSGDEKVNDQVTVAGLDGRSEDGEVNARVNTPANHRFVSRSKRAF